MPTIVVTGANRGLGLEFVRQYAADGWCVVAGCRQPEKATGLQALARTGDVQIHALDTVSDASVKAFRASVGDIPVNVLICSAGFAGGERQKFEDIDFATMSYTLEVNTAGPLRVAEAFAPNLSETKDAKLIAITSQMGAIALTTSSEMMLYRISKAALNEAWKCIAIDLQPKGVTAAVLHPGWVATDMGGPDAPVTPEQSIAGMRQVIAGLTQDDAGTFLTFEGRSLPW